jgi:hypothetical protein
MVIKEGDFNAWCRYIRNQGNEQPTAAANL